MTLPINQIVHGDCLEVMTEWPDGCVDLCVTSPPYGLMRDYKGYSLDVGVLVRELYQKMKEGGVVVWVVGDQVVNGGESGQSFRQALIFQERFLIYDTMIYHRQAANPPTNRYWQNFEYMFVFSKGCPKTTNIIRDRKNKYRKMGGDNVRQRNGQIVKGQRSGIGFAEYGIRENIWYYPVGGGLVSSDPIAHEHPAIFPESLAADHIKSWSSPDDVVVDPMSGSGTTCVAAKLLGRNYIGIDISEEYCEIARERIKAIETGVPVKEAKAGQGGLFE